MNTNRLLLRALVLGAGAALALTSAASATVYGWNYNGSNPASDPSGGTIERINASFDTSSKQLTWNVQFAPSPGSSALNTQGFWLVINNGPNPKNNPGELAIFYFDASAVGQTPKLSVYGYNGKNAADSWIDGNPAVAGNQPGDLIKGSKQTGYIQSISSVDVNVPGLGMRRVMSMTIDATDIINHSPLYPVAGTDWYGTGFDQKIGVWFHPVRTFSAAYDPGATGQIKQLSLGTSGWLDTDNLQTTVIPTPGAAGLLVAGAGLLARRRRSA